MKAILAAILLAAGAGASAQVSVTIGQPGFYGRIDIGGFAPPPVIYTRPVIVERRVRTIEQEPLYLRVPPGHAKNWAKHCHKYNACAQPVLFVQDRWYTNEYAPRVRAGRNRPHGSQGAYPSYDGRGDYRDQGRRDYREQDRRYDEPGRRDDDRRDDGPGHGKGHGKGHDKGHGKGHGKHD